MQALKTLGLSGADLLSPDDQRPDSDDLKLISDDLNAVSDDLSTVSDDLILADDDLNSGSRHSGSPRYPPDWPTHTV